LDALLRYSGLTVDKELGRTQLPEGWQLIDPAVEIEPSTQMYFRVLPGSLLM
jgi:hypothetical protein